MHMYTLYFVKKNRPVIYVPVVNTGKYVYTTIIYQLGIS